MWRANPLEALAKKCDVNICSFEDRFIMCFFRDCECLNVTVCFSQSWWPFVHAETWCACAAGTSCDVFHDHGSTCITESYNYLELTVKAPENRSTTQKGNVIFQLLASGRLRAIPKFEIFAPKHYGWIGGRMTPVLKEGCDVGHSQRDVFREAGEKNEERRMGPFLIKHVVLNIKYTNTYNIYIYIFAYIYLCVHDNYIQFAECPSILRAGTLHHLRSLAQDYSWAVRKLRLVGLCTGWYYAVMWGLSGIIINNL